MRGSPDQINNRDDVQGYCTHKRQFIFKSLKGEKQRKKEKSKIWFNDNTQGSLY